MKRLPCLCAIVCAFASLILFPDAAADGVRQGLNVCAVKIIPSLLPFFIVSSLMASSGVASQIGKALSPISSKLFHVSSVGGSAFIMGLLGGYPLGAAYISEIYGKGMITAKEAERLLIFCNNSGPAFIVGAVGIGVFCSSAVGLFLYAVHIIAALIGGIIYSPGKSSAAEFAYEKSGISFSKVFTVAVKSSVEALINVCGFILAFSTLVSLLDASGGFSVLVGNIAHRTGAELSFVRALLIGALEIGSSISSMGSLAISPLNLALAAFILGWGGLSVHFQTFAVISETNIKTARYITGRFFIAAAAAAIAYSLSSVFF